MGFRAIPPLQSNFLPALSLALPRAIFGHKLWVPDPPSLSSNVDLWAIPARCSLERPRHRCRPHRIVVRVARSPTPAHASQRPCSACTTTTWCGKGTTGPRRCCRCWRGTSRTSTTAASSRSASTARTTTRGCTCGRWSARASSTRGWTRTRRGSRCGPATRSPSGTSRDCGGSTTSSSSRGSSKAP